MHSVKSSRVEKHSERSEKKHTSSRKRSGGAGETCREVFDKYNKKQELINNFLTMDTFFLYKLALEKIQDEATTDNEPAADEESAAAEGGAPAANKRPLGEYTNQKKAFDVVYNAMNQIANAIKSQSGVCSQIQIQSVMNLDDNLTSAPQSVSQNFDNLTDITNANITNILKWCEKDLDFETFKDDSKKQQMIDANPLKEKIVDIFS